MLPQMSSKLDDSDKEALVKTTRRLLVDLQALSSRLAAVQEVSTQVNRSLNLTEIMHVLGNQIKWILDFDVCSVSLYDSEADTLEIRLISSLSAENTLQALDTEARLAINSGQSQLLTSPARLIVPLESEQQCVGTINFISYSLEKYTNEDVRIVHLLALQLANAIRNARRYTELTQLYETLHSVESMRDNLMNMIVHDLRTPLGTLIQSIELMQKFKEVAPEKSKKYDNIVRLSITRMKGMIDDLLVFGKGKDSSLEPNYATFLISDFLNALKIDHQMRADLKQQSIIYESDNNDKVVFADIDLLTRVLDNLVTNAIKFTPPAGQIVIATCTLNNLFHVSVIDNGVGITVEQQKKIFDKYAQVNEKHSTYGVGLGLAFCKMVLEAHNGTIGVERNTIEGSTFWFSLPYAHP